MNTKDLQGFLGTLEGNCQKYQVETNDVIALGKEKCFPWEGEMFSFFQCVPPNPQERQGFKVNYI